MTDQDRLDWIDRNGGFAFPGTLAMPGGGTYETAGMTMRDWFAGQVMVGILSNLDLSGETFEHDAAAAYRAADAMLAERAKAVRS